MAAGRTDAHSVLDLPGAGNLRAGTAPHLRRPGLEFPLPGGRGRQARRLPHHLHGLDAGDRGARLRRRDLRVREPLRAPRRADLPRRRRQGARLHLRLSRLELRPEGQPQGRRLRGRRRRQRRHAEELLPRRITDRASCASRSFSRARVRQPERRRAADRGVSRRGDRRPHHARAAQAGGGDRPLHADAATTTGSSTSRTSRTPITRACCTRSSRPSASTGCRSAAAWWSTRAAAITRASRSSTRHVDRPSVFGDGHPLREGGLHAEGPEPAAHRRRVRRRLQHADPHRVPGLRAAADPERAGGPADPARRA